MLFRSCLSSAHTGRVSSQITANDVKCRSKLRSFDELFPPRTIAGNSMQKKHGSDFVSSTRQDRIAKTGSRSFQTFGNFRLEQSISQILFFVVRAHSMSLRFSEQRIVPLPCFEKQDYHQVFRSLLRAYNRYSVRSETPSFSASSLREPEKFSTAQSR